MIFVPRCLLSLVLLLGCLLLGSMGISRDDELASYARTPPGEGVVYNREVDAIAEGRRDHAKRVGAPPHSLLCATFTRPGLSRFAVIADNIVTMGAHCQWAIVLYSGPANEEVDFCNRLNASAGTVVHCQRSSLTETPRYGRSLSPDPRRNTSVLLSTPKSVLYHALIPFLPRYERVLLMDDDISLLGFDYPALARIWSCAFATPPLIVQPLVVGAAPQYLSFVNWRAWQRPDHASVLASACGLVEQQVPLFDAEFFTWFVQRVLIHTLSASLRFGADWGHDRSWCRAAAAYSEWVLGRPRGAVACALIVGAPPVRHLDLRSMANKRAHRQMFRDNAARAVRAYAELFPSWVSAEAIRPNNPLDPHHRSLYPRAVNLSHCPVGVAL